MWPLYKVPNQKDVLCQSEITYVLIHTYTHTHPTVNLSTFQLPPKQSRFPNYPFSIKGQTTSVSRHEAITIYTHTHTGNTSDFCSIQVLGCFSCRQRKYGLSIHQSSTTISINELQDVFFYIVLYWVILYYIILRYIILYHIILYYIML